MPTSSGRNMDGIGCESLKAHPGERCAERPLKRVPWNRTRATVDFASEYSHAHRRKGPSIIDRARRADGVQQRIMYRPESAFSLAPSSSSSRVSSPGLRASSEQRRKNNNSINNSTSELGSAAAVCSAGALRLRRTVARAASGERNYLREHCFRPVSALSSSANSCTPSLATSPAPREVIGAGAHNADDQQASPVLTYRLLDSGVLLGPQRLRARDSPASSPTARGREVSDNDVNVPRENKTPSQGPPRFDAYGARVVEGEHAARTYADSTFVSYDGQYARNRRTGAGRLTLADGTTIEGTFTADGELNGHGVKIWPDGARYEGEFLRGEPHGEGQFWGTGGVFYKGSFAHGFRSGAGVLKRYNREIYEGTFENGLFHGPGKLVVRGLKTVEGAFALGRPHGYCKCVYTGGDIFEGTFAAGLESGEGTFTCALTRTIYCGRFEAGVRCAVPNCVALVRLQVRAPEKPLDKNVWRESVMGPDPYTNTQLGTPFTIKVSLAHATAAAPLPLSPPLGGAASLLTVPPAAAAVATAAGGGGGSGDPVTFIPQRRGRRASAIPGGHPLVEHAGAGGRAAGRKGTIAAATAAKQLPSLPPLQQLQTEESGRLVRVQLLRVPPGTPPASVTNPQLSAGVCPLIDPRISDDALDHMVSASAAAASTKGISPASRRATAKNCGSSTSATVTPQHRLSVASAASNNPNCHAPDESAPRGMPHSSPLLLASFDPINAAGEADSDHMGDSFSPKKIVVESLLAPTSAGAVNFTIRPALGVEPGEYVAVVTADPAVVLRPGTGVVARAPAIAPLCVPLRFYGSDKFPSQSGREASSVWGGGASASAQHPLAASSASLISASEES